MERIASLPRNHHMTYPTIIIPGHKDKIEINEADTLWPRWSSTIWDVSGTNNCLGTMPPYPGHHHIGLPPCVCVTGTPGVSSVTICCSLLLMINNPNIVDENWPQLPRLILPPGLFICLLAFCPTLLMYKDFVFSLVQGIWNVVVVDCKAKSSPLRNWFATLCFPSENPSKVYKNRPIPSVISGRDQRFARDQNGETIREIVAVMTWQRTWTDCVSLVLLTLGCFVAISESSGSYTTMIGTIHNMNREHSHHKQQQHSLSETDQPWVNLYFEQYPRNSNCFLH